MKVGMSDTMLPAVLHISKYVLYLFIFECLAFFFFSSFCLIKTLYQSHWLVYQ